MAFLPRLLGKKPNIQRGIKIKYYEAIIKKHHKQCLKKIHRKLHGQV